MKWKKKSQKTQQLKFPLILNFFYDSNPLECVLSISHGSCLFLFYLFSFILIWHNSQLVYETGHSTRACVVVWCSIVFLSFRAIVVHWKVFQKWICVLKVVKGGTYTKTFVLKNSTTNVKVFNVTVLRELQVEQQKPDVFSGKPGAYPSIC